MQGYVDGELKAGEKVILEEHVADCAGCKHTLREHQSCAALLFEIYGEHKLQTDMTSSVMAHLPSRDEMDFPVVDVEGVNWRAKHPSRTRERLNRFIPIAAAALLLVLAGVIRNYWPSQPVPHETIGVVLQIDGSAERVEAEDDLRRTAAVELAAFSGDRFVTSSGSRL
ncbi:MAG: zf-HC2 domain-containing protein, partial [Candidatus Hydrogenedentales bacterium]